MATLDVMPRQSKPPTETVRIDRDVARKARAIAGILGMTLPDYLTAKLRPAVEADVPEATARMKSKRAMKDPPPAAGGKG